MKHNNRLKRTKHTWLEKAMAEIEERAIREESNQHDTVPVATNTLCQICEEETTLDGEVWYCSVCHQWLCNFCVLGRAERVGMISPEDAQEGKIMAWDCEMFFVPVIDGEGWVCPICAIMEGANG